MSKIKELLDDIKKVRNNLVAQSNPHFQDLTNIIYKWETKIATDELEPIPCPMHEDYDEIEQKEEEYASIKYRR